MRPETTKELSLVARHVEPPDERRSSLERRANAVRARLLRTIDALDSRRHQVQEIGHHAKRVAVPLLGTVLATVVLAAGSVLAIRVLARRRREGELSVRIARLVEPFRIARPLPFWQGAARKLSLTVLTILVSELAKRSAKALLDGRVLAFLPLRAGGQSPPLVHEPRLLGAGK
jgi:hypothetical protein